MIQQTPKQPTTGRYSWRTIPDAQEWRQWRIESLKAHIKTLRFESERDKSERILRNVTTAPTDRIAAHIRQQHDEATQERLRTWQHVCRGPRYLDCRLSEYKITSDAQREAVTRVTEFRSNLPWHLENGSNLILHGTVGTGKDFLMAALLRTIVLDIVPAVRVTWQTGTDIASSAKQQLGSLPRSVAALAISDPVSSGDEALYYTQQRLTELLDHQYSERQGVWITANCTGRKQLSDMLGPHLADRVAHDAVVIPCLWESYRKPQLAPPVAEPPPRLLSDEQFDLS